MASRLADSVSPYLRAHAENPVAWFPWGEEAFAEARRRDVPVFVSIGYSTCHWCHVMARESFADPELAAVLNAGFVSVKVDREEHPEVDEAFLAAASAFTRNLGWPLSVITTPEGRAFFAGTYFPPEDRAGLPGFGTVLAAARAAWTERRADVESTAAALREALDRAGDAAADALPTAAELVDAAARATAREDVRFGGFAAEDAGPQTPKFPMAPALRFLQAPLLSSADPGAAEVAERALAAMAASELRDSVDGGFFRYTTRRDWTVPHYERMLTDNAGLLDVALDAGAWDVARGIAGFLLDTLQQPSGGFAAAQDSESVIDGARSEGGFYLRDAAGRAKLAPPAIDGKIVTGWNGLAIGALARAGVVFGDSTLIDAARTAADAVLEINTTVDGVLLRASLDEIPSRAAAVLEDYGLFAGGLVALAVAAGEPAYAERARSVVDQCLGPDGAVGAPGGGDPVLRGQGTRAPATASDGASPSGPSAFADAALRLWTIGAGERYRDAAASVVRRYAAEALAEPLSHGALLRVAADLAVAPRQLVVIAGKQSGPLVDAARAASANVVAIVSADQARAFASAGFSLFEGKKMPFGKAIAYDCVGFTCRLPTTDPRDLR